MEGDAPYGGPGSGAKDGRWIGICKWRVVMKPRGIFWRLFVESWRQLCACGSRGIEEPRVGVAFASWRSACSVWGGKQFPETILDRWIATDSAAQGCREAELGLNFRVFL
ncbi:hypothetical protein V6N13_039136 [Hibiscus sabdariffa]